MKIEWIGGVDTNDTIDDVIRKLKSANIIYMVRDDNRAIRFNGNYEGYFGEYVVVASYPQNFRVTSMIFKHYPDSKESANRIFITSLSKLEAKYGNPGAYDFDLNTVEISNADMDYLEIAQWNIGGEFMEISVGYDKVVKKYRFGVIVSNRMNK